MKESSTADEWNLSCGWKHLKWRHYSIKRRLFNVRRRLFSAKRRLFKTLHRRANVLSPNTNHPYTHIYPDFHPWPTPQSQYYKAHSLVLQNALACIYPPSHPLMQRADIFPEARRLIALIGIKSNREVGKWALRAGNKRSRTGGTRKTRRTFSCLKFKYWAPRF